MKAQVGPADREIEMALMVVERKIGAHALRIETGKLGKLALATTVVSYGDTVVLASVVGGSAREGTDFFPLTVDYREKAYAAGKIPGGFYKRESRPSTKEILTMRLIDRPVRPRFPKDYRDEVLIQAMCLATDQQHDPDVLSSIAASAALHISSLPFEGPLGTVRVGYCDGRFVLFPTLADLEGSQFELVLSGTREGVIMIEVAAMEVAEDLMAEAIAFAQGAVLEICDLMEELREKAGKAKEWTPPAENVELAKKVRKKCEKPLKEARRVAEKLARAAAVDDIYEKAVEEFVPADAPKGSPAKSEVTEILQKIEEEIITRMVLDEGVRSDGRGPTDIREITCEVGVLPRVHGSALFQRGQTQALVTVTMGTGRDEQIIDGLTEEYSKKFMLHYNFPPLATGEVKKVGAVSRREIGHGALAEKSLEPVMPNVEAFPYTVRVVSEILESNGSSSMASVCGGTLALMDAGVPIRRPVAGISVGMFDDGKKHALVVDILGEEDHFGLMDFKVSGTQKGITGIQLDLKAKHITHDRIIETFKLARQARLDILRTMLKTSGLRAPRAELSEYAPRLLTVNINPEKIGKLIGPGGSGIRGIEAMSGAKVEVNDDGTVLISSTDGDKAIKARDMVEAVTAEVKVGRVYEGKVVSVKDFGAFIEIIPGTDGMCHISELSSDYIRNVSEVCQVGDILKVKVISVDDQGRIKLSRKAVLLEEAEAKRGALNPA